MEGFRYVTKEINPSTGARGEKSEDIIMGKDIKEKYILEDLDPSMLMWFFKSVIYIRLRFIIYF